MAGEVTFQMTEADYVGANRAMFRCSVRRRRTMWIWLSIFAALVVLGALLGFGERDRASQIGVTFGFACWGLVALPLICTLSYLLLPQRAQKLFRQHKAFHTPISFSWNDEGLHQASKSGAVLTVWSDLHGWFKSRKFYLLYVTDTLYFILPSRFLSDAKREDLEATLAAQYVQRF